MRCPQGGQSALRFLKTYTPPAQACPRETLSRSLWTGCAAPLCRTSGPHRQSQPGLKEPCSSSADERKESLKTVLQRRRLHVQLHVQSLASRKPKRKSWFKGMSEKALQMEIMNAGKRLLEALAVEERSGHLRSKHAEGQDILEQWQQARRASQEAEQHYARLNERSCREPETTMLPTPI